jgi:hypothetical protein
MAQGNGIDVKPMQCHCQVCIVDIINSHPPPPVFSPAAMQFYERLTLAVLNLVPPVTGNCVSIGDTPINLVYLWGIMHIVDLIC